MTSDNRDSQNKNQDQEHGPLREHSFDGISEYDNQLPRWWVNKFWLTIIFSVIYFYWYQISGSGRGLIEDFDRTEKQAAVERSLQESAKPAATEEVLQAMLKQDDVLKAGAALYQARCVSCHGSGGEGSVGPNLTDDYWIHGGKLTAIVYTVTNGVPAKGMIPWKALLSTDEIQQVSVFVKSLRGNLVKNPKQPEGSLEIP